MSFFFFSIESLLERSTLVTSDVMRCAIYDNPQNFFISTLVAYRTKFPSPKLMSEHHCIVSPSLFHPSPFNIIMIPSRGLRPAALSAQKSLLFQSSVKQFARPKKVCDNPPFAQQL